MSPLTNWREAFADPRFWAGRYWFVDEPVVADLLGVSSQQCDDYYRDQVIGDEEDPVLVTRYGQFTSGSTLWLCFPESYSWRMEITQEGDFHTIFHPQVYPHGILIAEESGHELLPGLRWAELKQMVACLQQEPTEAFESSAIFPLLYPVVQPVTFEELDDVRQTLHAAWQALHLFEPPQLDLWLDAILQVYEKGKVLYYDHGQGWYEPDYAVYPATDLPLWTYDPDRGWHTNNRTTLRQDSSPFNPFFEMLERHAHEAPREWSY